MQKSKKQQVIEAVQSENWKRALSISKNFKRDFNEDQLRSIQIGADCINGNSLLYSQMGIDTIAELNKAKQILKNYK